MALAATGVTELRTWIPEPIQIEEAWYKQGSEIIPVYEVKIASKEPTADFEVIMGSKGAIDIKNTMAAFGNANPDHKLYIRPGNLIVDDQTLAYEGACASGQTNTNAQTPNIKLMDGDSNNYQEVCTLIATESG